MALDATLSAALDAAGVRAFTAVKIELPANTIRLLAGSGLVTFGGETFAGDDAIFGTLANIDATAESIADQAPTVNLTLYAPSARAISLLLQPEVQDSLVTVWFGLVNEATGAAIGVPEKLWVGRVDTGRVMIGDGSQAVELATVSAFDRLFAAEEGSRLNPTWHKSIWPDETGLDRAIAVQTEVFWGTATTGGASGGSGGVTGGSLSGGSRNIWGDNAAEY